MREGTYHETEVGMRLETELRYDNYAPKQLELIAAGQLILVDKMAD
jgi:hypothetical protein